MTSSLVADVTFEQPTIQYSSIYPVLIVLVAACVGVLIEAALPRSYRYLTQVILSLGALGAALIGTIWVAADLTPIDGDAARGQIVAEGALAVDGPTVFIWGVLLALSIISVMLMAERRLEGGVTAFAGQAAFFFSSRRRHTRCLSDWSSDVCSSD